MAIFLVIAMFTILIALDWFFNYRGKPEPATITLAPQVKPQEATLHYHPGLSWLRTGQDGQVVVGTSEFSSRFIGKIERVELPRTGTRFRQGEPAWTLVAANGRRLSQVMPVDGEVTQVNYDLLKEPELLSRSPLQLGWCLRVKPVRLDDSLRNMLPARMAGDWLESLKSLVVSKLPSTYGEVAADGGEAVTDLGDRLDDQTWEEVARGIFPLQFSTHRTQGSIG